MNLPQMYALANGKSGYARSDGEILGALNRAGAKVFFAILKEFRGFFLKFDETSLKLEPGTTEYALPADLSQIVNLAERLAPSLDWSPMTPIGLTLALADIQSLVGWSDNYLQGYGNQSPFGFYGPYLDSAATTGTQTSKIRVSPGIDVERYCQIAYTAKWVPIVDQSSKVMLPDEGTYAMESFASAELCAMSDDTRASAYAAQGRDDLTSFLSWLRERQIMQRPTIESYGPGY